MHICIIYIFYTYFVSQCLSKYMHDYNHDCNIWQILYISVHIGDVSLVSSHFRIK